METFPPSPSPGSTRYHTLGGVRVHRTTRTLPEAATVIDRFAVRLDSSRGVLLTSDYEFPGRHRRWSVGLADPPLVITARHRDLRLEPLNQRGHVMLTAIAPYLSRLDAVLSWQRSPAWLELTVREQKTDFPEEDRSRQPSVFSVLRSLIELFFSAEDEYLGLYGAFGYDLVFQFEHMERLLPRDPGQRDLVLYLPDELTVVDAASDRAVQISYDFDFDIAGASTRDLPRDGTASAYSPQAAGAPVRDHAPGEYAQAVDVAREAFRRGELFEVVLSQVFSRPCPSAPSVLFRRLRRRNQAPYAALLNLGDGEYLVSSSPAMYVKVTRRAGETWMESCPISGTTSRGADAIGDAEAIAGLLGSAKDTSELTMCTDVDRNDKSRVCDPDSVQVIGRRQIELFADVIHTVDHIVGRLKADRDAIDAFLTHMWAVTVTGAPKLWGMRFVEQHERTARRWYGGAFGYLAFNGELSTGITLRSLQLKDGVATARGGATLLFDSDPSSEERESELKVGLFLDILERETPAAATAGSSCPQTGQGQRILLIDNEDSFVHTLGGYFRRTGAEVTTVRAPMPPGQLTGELERLTPDLLVLSPGPGVPEDFAMSRTISLAIARGIPIFGVCLGLQGIVEFFGGKLEAFPAPVHGKTTQVSVRDDGIFSGLPDQFEVGRYHSLHAPRADLPPELEVTAEAQHVVMAIEHRDYPIAATQFHPESIMTSQDGIGLHLIANVVKYLSRSYAGRGPATG